MIKDDPEPEITYPRDSTLKGSESTWIQVYALKAKIVAGNPTDLIGKTSHKTLTKVMRQQL